ncbi:MAG TPA: DUF899 domain-containing protein [Thermoleophilaceae bacterium]|nr:DUF899 domain-containing protein [Thermoleophilaceae bacterium]
MSALPPIVSREEWLAARVRLLEREKELTRARDALNGERRRLGMVRVEEDYVFEGPAGRVRLPDLFEGRRQLVVQHFMFDPGWDDGCPSCSWAADEVSEGRLRHLHEGDTSFAAVSRAPIEKIEDYRRRRGWTFPWYSSYGSDFNRDFGVTLEEGGTYNYRAGAPAGEAPGFSCFLRDGEDVFHTYSTYARGTETVGGAHYFLDLTALGRQQEFERRYG